MRVAKDAIPEGNTCLALRDRLEAIFDTHIGLRASWRTGQVTDFANSHHEAWPHNAA
jgi:hypothetical protein